MRFDSSAADGRYGGSRRGAQGGHTAAGVGRYGGSRRGAQGGDNSAGVSRPNGSPRGAREGDSLAHRGSGSSFFASLVARVGTARLPDDFSEMMSYPQLIHTSV